MEESQQNVFRKFTYQTLFCFLVVWKFDDEKHIHYSVPCFGHLNGLFFFFLFFCPSSRSSETAFTYRYCSIWENEFLITFLHLIPFICAFKSIAQKDIISSNSDYSLNLIASLNLCEPKALH